MVSTGAIVAACVAPPFGLLLLALLAWLAAPAWLGWLEGCLIRLQGGARKRAANPYLAKNYAPVHEELFVEDLPVQGEMPPALDGVFIRTGPNPFFTPKGNYHWFDGDGMLHACRIRGGRVAYCNRFVRTARLLQEEATGRPLVGKMGDMTGWSALGHMVLASLKKARGVYTNKEGLGTANTALVYHARRLLVLHEGDLPYAVRIMCCGLIETLGRATFGGKIDHAVTAHPKIDQTTGALHFFGYHTQRRPFCTYSVADAAGRVVSSVPVDLPDPIMMHDFAMTEDYVIFLDVPLVLTPKVMIKEKRIPFTFQKERGSRFGVLPKGATDPAAMRWFSLPGMMIFHTANAWQEGDVIRLFACCFEEFDLDLSARPETSVAEAMLPYVWELTFDLASGAAARRRLAALPGDFPQVPPRLVGRRTRYMYLASWGDASDSTAGFTAIGKLDLEAKEEGTAVVGLARHGPGRTGGEAYFVPRGTGGRAESPGGEDEGYLVTYVYDEAAAASDLVVYDAKTMSSQPVARVRLPQRVPHGFHCLHLAEAQLRAQAAGLGPKAAALEGITDVDRLFAGATQRRSKAANSRGKTEAIEVVTQA